MEPIPREIPRYPGPKTAAVFTAQVTESQGKVQIGEILPGQGVFVLQGIDCNVVATGSQVPSPTFQVLVSFDATANPQFIVFSGQINPNTGFYFAWRGELVMGNSSVIFFDAVAETWDVIAWGYLTPTG